MRQAIPDKIRDFVAKRANFRCEYCQIHNSDMFLAFEIDHIIPIKHEGKNDIENLAYACPHCNQHKGTDFATITKGDIIPLYNPRKELWQDHFETENGEIIPKTQIGEATIKIFKFNKPDLLILRRILHEVGRYP